MLVAMAITTVAALAISNRANSGFSRPARLLYKSLNKFRDSKMKKKEKGERGADK